MSEQDETTAVLDVDTDRVDDTEDDAPLGPKGEKAFEAEKERRKAASDRARKAESRNKELEERLAKLEAGDGDKPDPDKIRAEARAEARAEVLKDRALDKIEAKAAKLFADPEDARALLASQVEDFLDGDKLDTEAIDDALADLLKRKPHLGATPPSRFAGSADGGARKGSGKPQQLTENDLKRMTSRQIVDAQEKGQLDDLLGNT